MLIQMVCQPFSGSASTPSRRIFELAFLVWVRSVTVCDIDNEISCGTIEVVSATCWISIVKMWIKYFAAHQERNLLTGLRFDFSGRPHSILRPTLLPHEQHDTPFVLSEHHGELRNGTIQSWGTNCFLRPDRISRILNSVDQTRDPVATLLERLPTAQLVTVSPDDINRNNTRGTIWPQEGSKNHLVSFPSTCDEAFAWVAQGRRMSSLSAMYVAGRSFTMRNVLHDSMTIADPMRRVFLVQLHTYSVLLCLPSFIPHEYIYPHIL